MSFVPSFRLLICTLYHFCNLLAVRELQPTREGQHCCFFVAYCSGPLPNEDLCIGSCLIHEAKMTLELGLYAG